MLHLHYICMRNLHFTNEFLEFLENSDDRLKKKMVYLLNILENQQTINSKIAKKLTNTELYEIRIHVNNEYRVITFLLDGSEINQSKEILFLNAFMKKSTKDYDKQIKTALKILEQWTEQK